MDSNLTDEDLEQRARARPQSFRLVRVDADDERFRDAFLIFDRDLNGYLLIEDEGLAVRLIAILRDGGAEIGDD